MRLNGKKRAWRNDVLCDRIKLHDMERKINSRIFILPIQNICLFFVIRGHYSPIASVFFFSPSLSLSHQDIRSYIHLSYICERAHVMQISFFKN